MLHAPRVSEQYTASRYWIMFENRYIIRREVLAMCSLENQEHHVALRADMIYETLGQVYFAVIMPYFLPLTETEYSSEDWIESSTS